MSSPDTHAVLIRPLATNRWGILEYAQSAKSAMLKAREQRTGLSRGDLILAIDIAEISAISERGKCLYFVDSSGVVRKAPDVSDNPPTAPTWFLAWEGPDADAFTMFELLGKTDRKLLVTTTCALARLALPHVSSGENRPRILFEIIEEWMRGKATADQVKAASDGAVDASDDTTDMSQASAALAIVRTASIISGYRSAAAYVAPLTASAMPGNYRNNLRQLSHIVRDYIPLHVALESWS